VARSGGHVFISYRRAEASHAAGRFNRVGDQALRTPTGGIRFWVELVVDERRIWASDL
jgi:hypothetical protein